MSKRLNVDSLALLRDSALLGRALSLWEEDGEERYFFFVWHFFAIAGLQFFLM